MNKLKILITMAKQLAKDISIGDQYYHQDICDALNKVFDNVKFEENGYMQDISVEEIE